MLKAFSRYGLVLLACCGVVAPAAVKSRSADAAVLPVAAQYHSFGRGRSPFDAVVSDDGEVLVLGRGGLLAVLSQDLRDVARKLDVDPAVNFLAGAVGPDGRIRLTDGAGRIWRVNEALTEVSVESSEPVGALFSIQYLIDGTGLAVGEFGTVLSKAPDADQWQPLTFDWSAALPRLAEKFGDVSPHLYRVCRAPAGGALVVGEYGVVMELTRGVWQVQQVSGEHGTLFSCLVTPEGRQVVAGQSGRLLVSDGAQKPWRPLNSGLTADIYDITGYASKLVVVAQDQLAYGSLDDSALTVAAAALPNVSWVVRAVPIREQLFLVSQEGYLVVDNALRLVGGSADGLLQAPIRRASR